MANLSEIKYIIGGIHKRNVSTYPLIPNDNNNNMSITLRFILKQRTHERQVNSDDNQIMGVIIDSDFPRIVSTEITLVPHKNLSHAAMREKLYDMGVTRDEIQNIAIKKVDDYVEGLVNDHLSLSTHPDWSKRGLKVELLLTISRVWVFDEQVIVYTDQDERLNAAADESVVRKLKRKRVDETMASENEKCSVCLEMLVEKELLIVLPCEHVFHKGCVSKWFKKSHFCPLCRFELPVAQNPQIIH